MTKLEGGDPVIENPPVALALSPSSSLPIPARYLEISHLRASLILGLKEHLSKRTGLIGTAVEEFHKKFNAGLLLPNIFERLGSISVQSLYRLKKDFNDLGIDGLIPGYGGAGRSKISDHEKNLVLSLLLNQNRLKIGVGITNTKEYLVKKGIESPSSPATIRRFVDQWKKDHYDAWIKMREGDKALNDKCLPYAERDWRLLTVGEGLVADGHRLNFQVIHPVTGKPCRAALVLFWDWKSSYPLGFEILVEENIQCVASALRNSILTLGKTPKWVLIDNGKAFRAKIFTEDISFEDTELPGMFARLNINYHFAQPYNAQAKPIERIFGILNEQLERLVPSYTGASIEDKPAWTKRNEKYAQSLHDPYVPTIPETSELIRAWRDRYAERPSRGRDGLRPIDILRQAQADPSQGFGKIDPNELIFLMMEREVKNVGRNGVTWLGWHWYDENLYGLKDKVVIRYSLSDLSQIYIFHKNEFLCAARPIEPVHPMASESENPKDMEAVKEVYRLKNKVKNTTRKLCDLLDTKQAAQIDWSRTKSAEIIETIQEIEEKKNPKVANTSPFVEGVCYSQDETPPPRYKPPREWRGYFEHWERYDYHQEQDPEMLTQEDREFIGWYKTTSEYEAVYGPKKNTRLLV